jgi:hypothetical protein
MPNAIKYNLSAETLALKKGNFYIGTGDVGKGPTSSTGYYNGITPPSGGYTIYLNKETGGPSIYTVTTEAQMVSLTNTIGAQSFTTSGQCLNWFATQTDKMIFNIDYPAIVTNGLVLNLDAGFVPSYPTTATTWYDVSSGGNNGTLVNGPTFSSANGGSIVYDGVNDYANQIYPTSGFPSGSQANTINIWLKIPSTNSQGMEPFGMGNNTGPSKRIGIWLPGTAQNGEGTSVGQIGVESVNSVVTTTSVQTTNTWVNFCSVFNGGLEDNFTLYINGSSVSISKYGRAASNPANIDISTAGSFLTFASIPSVPNVHMYNGPIGSTQIYNRTLTASEVLQNYNAQKGRFGL